MSTIEIWRHDANGAKLMEEVTLKKREPAKSALAKWIEENGVKGEKYQAFAPRTGLMKLEIEEVRKAVLDE